MGSKEAYLAWKKEQDQKNEEERAKRRAAVKPQPKVDRKVEPKKEATNEESKTGRPLRMADARKAGLGGALPEPRRVVPRNAGVGRPPEPERFPPVPRPPGDVSRWRERDFLVARIREQPELFEALAALPDGRRNGEEVGEIVTQLLQPEHYSGLRELELSGEDKRRVSVYARKRGEKPFLQRVIDAGVEALASCDAPATRHALGQIIVGNLATEDNRAAVNAALESLAAHPSPAHEQMLFRVAVEAEQIVADKAALPPQNLSRQAFTLLNKAASPQSRVRLAEYLVKNDPPEPTRRSLVAVLSELTPENLDAHVVLYTGLGETVPPRDVLAKQFHGYSSEALQDMLGLKQPVDSEQLKWSRYVAERLWTKSFALVVEGRLNRLDSWGQEPALLLLALSLPTDAMRTAIAQKLQHQWGQGPSEDASQLISGELIEPGLLVLFRGLLEERGDAWKTPSLASLRNQRSSRSRSKRADPVSTHRQRQWEIHDAWASLAGDLAESWCSRCRSAAHDRDAAERALGRTVDWSRGLEQLPIRPHTTDRITAAQTATWTADSPTSVGDYDPLQVDYVRIEERTRPTRLLAYYARILPDHERRDIANGTCFEGMGDDAEPGFVQSIDVRITRASASEVRRLPDEEQDLVVEILAVKIHAPDAGPFGGGN